MPYGLTVESATKPVAGIQRATPKAAPQKAAAAADPVGRVHAPLSAAPDRAASTKAAARLAYRDGSLRRPLTFNASI